MDQSLNKLSSPLPDTVIFAIHIINPFHPSFEKTKYSFISSIKAREKILRFFKTTTKEETQKSSRQNTESDFADQIIPYNFKKKFTENINWISEIDCSENPKKLKVSQFDFRRTAISALLYVIKASGLRYSIFYSRSQDSYFCKVYAGEEWLRDTAYRMDYCLKLKKKPSYVHDFQKVSPYAPISLKLKSTDDQIPFVHYDENSEESDSHYSLFTFADKYRIVTTTLSMFIDIHYLKQINIIYSIFALHEPGPLDFLRTEWANFSSFQKPQPMVQIKTYFSEQIAFYFEWMETYKVTMFVCAVVGLLVFFSQFLASFFDWSPYISLSLQISFNVFLSVWGVIFQKYWLRRETILAWQWGTLNLIHREAQREQFQGEFKRDEPSGKMRLLRTNKQSVLESSIKIMTVTVITILITIVIAIVILVFQLRVYMMTQENLRDFGPIISATVYAIEIKIFDIIYSRIAQWFNNWENYETVTEHNNHLALKLFLFQFINNYSGLFYIAFFKTKFEGCSEHGCMFDMGLQLVIIFITNLLLNLAELGIPKALFLLRGKVEERKLRSRGISIKELMNPIEMQSQMEPYDCALEDYLEMCIQFGFVALFGASFPLVALLALFEIILEIRVDAWKLCYAVRRPDPVRSGEIGIWKKIISCIAYIGVFTNSAIIIFTSELLKDSPVDQKVLIFVVLEHVLMILIWIINQLIELKPEKVEKGLAWSKRVVKNKMNNMESNMTTPVVSKIKDEKSFDIEFKLRYYL